MSRLLERVRRVVQAWPVDATRTGGRDLGEHLQSPAFLSSFEALLRRAPAKAEESLAALERLQASEAKQQHQRVADCTFTGDIGSSWGFGQLSSESQKGFNKNRYFDKSKPRP